MTHRVRVGLPVAELCSDGHGTGVRCGAKKATSYVHLVLGLAVRATQSERYGLGLTERGLV
jgi:hypothetical protein